MVNYEKGKIYKIVCNKTGNTYIGSTCEKLSNRLAHHRRAYKYYLNANKMYSTSFEVLKNDDYNIVLIEEVNCKNKDQLLSRERFYIDSISCVNKCKPTRTVKQWCEENKDKIKQMKQEKAGIIKEQMKKYREVHKEHIRQRTKEYKERNKDKINEQTREYRKLNREKIKNYKCRCDKYTCECGSTLLLNNKTNHIKTQKHILFIENKEKISNIL
jgi:hypothetical protein